MEIPFFNRVTIKDKAFLSRQLSTMLSSGLAIDRAVGVLATQTKKKAIKEALERIGKDLEGGQKFSAAVSRFPKIFDKVYVNVAISGEAVGKLADVLTHLADELEKQDNFVGKIRGAVMYPAFILVAMIGVVILMLVKVVPQLSQVFAESGVQLPWTTRFLVSSSNFFVNYWWLAILILIALIIVIRLVYLSKTGVYFINRLIINLPGGVGQDIYMARFSRTLGMLVSSGTPIIEAMRITGDVINNAIYRDSLANVASQLERGIPISVPIEKDPNFPVIVSQMISVGEQTGQLDKVLDNLAEYYETQSDDKIKNISSLFEPVLIVIIGIGVGFIIFSILGPIYSIAQLQ